jgi:hypothetical protein
LKSSLQGLTCRNVRKAVQPSSARQRSTVENRLFLPIAAFLCGTSIPAAFTNAAFYPLYKICCYQISPLLYKTSFYLAALDKTILYKACSAF